MKKKNMRSRPLISEWMTHSLSPTTRRVRVAFAFIALVGYSTFAAAGELPVPGESYRIQARHSGLYLDVLGQGQNDGDNVGQWELHEGEQQQWIFEPVPGGEFNRIKAAHSGEFLDVLGQKTENGANVGQWRKHEFLNQQWALERAEGEYFRIRARHSNKYLDVLGRSTEAGANVAQWIKDPGYQQQWKLVPVNAQAAGVPEVGKAMGHWESFCAGGQACTAEIKESLSVGTISEESWNASVRASVTVAIESGVEVPGASAKTTITGELETEAGKAASIAKTKDNGYEKGCSLSFDQVKYQIHGVWQWVVKVPVGDTEVRIGTCTVVCTPHANSGAPTFSPVDPKAEGTCLRLR